METRVGLAIACALLAVAGTVGCDASSSMTMAGGWPAGDPIEMPSRPDDATCEKELRGDPSLGVVGREWLGAQVDSTMQTARAAAADPAADVFTYGIPLSTAEIASLGAAGIGPSAETPYAVRQDQLDLRFIGVDDRTGAFTVAVGGGDGTTLERLRCLEITSIVGKVRYVTAYPSDLTLQRETARIRSDIGALRSAGLPVTEVWMGRECHCVMVEIEPFREAAGQALIDRYGGIIQVSTDNRIPGR